MSKVFRLYTGGTNTYQGWNDNPSFPYNSTNRDTIADPDGASSKNEITSIPSPFARIDLVKTAFKEVVKSKDLDGNTIFHKMVSDTLDVAEIFFNLEKFKGKVEVVKWDPSLMLVELESSESIGHQYLADALRKFMKSDAKTYNFDQLRNIYLLNYINGPDELNIIGATSPATLFFSNANNLSYVNDIFFGEDRPFDCEYQPLYKRDFALVKYLFALRKTIPYFSNLFPEVDAYLNLTYNKVGDVIKKQELQNVNAATFTNLSTIDVIDNQQSDLVEVLGHNLYRKTSQIDNSKPSEFTINATSSITTIKPLVLPVESGNRYRDLQYTTGKWGTTNKAPYVDLQDDLSKRTLPYDGAQTPYLTISDFLEDTIARVPHTLNREHYFDGNANVGKSELSYLLPLKARLFEYFSVEDIQGTVSDGKNMIDMELLAGESVKVTLRIPIAGNSSISYIEYTRIYYNNRKADISVNEGGTTEFAFDGLVMPMVKFNNPNDAIYNIASICNNTSKYDFSFYDKGVRIVPTSVASRNENKEYITKSTNYLIEKSNFDIITVTNRDGKTGLIIPLFQTQRNLSIFEFAVDLGTSNTHIEYKKNNSTPEVFSIDAKEIQACAFFTSSKDSDGNQLDLIRETQVIEKDFIPDSIGIGDYKFPTRTVLSGAKTTDWTNVVSPYLLVNIPFTYDKREPLPYNAFNYNIKWGKGTELAIMDAYVRCLMLMVRNKVLLNNGDLSKTKITWFYPISMAPKRLKNLQSTWDDAYTKYFGEGRTFRMTESSAPIQYFFRRYATATNLVNVDIGGGTTDIAFAKNKTIEYVTSFRFAANNLFENPFSDLDVTNGIVDSFKEGIRTLLEDKKLGELVTVLESDSNIMPSNMASFLFGLKDNALAQKNGVSSKSIDFNYILQEDENFKIVFILFYSAIIYHIAQIIKALHIDVPRHISFSGNGSKVIRIITTDAKVLAKYTKLLFEKVLGRLYGKELDILGLDKDSSPKESTCKGGLVGEEEDDTRDKIVIFKSDNSGFINENDTYDNINDTYLKGGIKVVEEFFRLILTDMNKSFSFKDNFGVSARSMKIADTTYNKDLMTYLEKGIAQRREESEGSDKIEETFFFYPIKGILNTISNEIGESLKSNE